MTTALDAKFVPKVRAALNKYGRDTSFVLDPTQVVDPVESRVTAGSPVTKMVKCTPPLEYDNRMIDGETVMRGDSYMIVSTVDSTGAAFTPDATTMKVSDGTLTWSIISVKTYKAGDDPAAYEIQLRR